MHPFCCVPADHNNSMPATKSSSAVTLGSDSVNNNNHHVSFNSVCDGQRNPTMRLTSGDQRDVKINDIVGSGISGIMHKWVNYGKGWRPRWFVLQDGVLSYYKIHGPDKIVVSKETEKGARVIGDESFRRLSRNRNSSFSIVNSNYPHRKPFGEVHLKVNYAFDMIMYIHVIELFN